MFHNRISRFQFLESSESEAAAACSSAFAAMPAFAMAGAGRANAAGASADIYRLAQQQARQQVAARRERARRSHEWN